MRPLPLSIISWLLVVMGAISLLTPIAMWTMRNEPGMKKAMEIAPLSLEATIALTVAAALVSIVSGIFLLRGAGWARWLYLAANIGFLFFSIATQGLSPSLIPGALMIAIVALIVFLPASNRYFAGQGDFPNA